jgi:hypothetical protein
MQHIEVADDKIGVAGYVAVAHRHKLAIEDEGHLSLLFF